ncbi:MAG: response regulator [Deltaproteobacteria bacterium]|nr:response regulator [Deltaproteobacteria bacterium]
MEGITSFEMQSKDKATLPPKGEGMQSITSLAVPPHILVLDDDILFGKILSKIASLKQVPLTFCTSVREVGKLPNWKFDIAIVDYDLGLVTGLQFVNYLERFMNTVPVILVSQYRQIKAAKWPTSVKGFIHKSVGPYEIFNMAVRIHEDSKATPLT